MRRASLSVPTPTATYPAAFSVISKERRNDASSSTTRIVASVAMTRRLGPAGKAQCKHRAAALTVRRRQRAALRLHKGARQGEPQPQARCTAVRIDAAHEFLEQTLGIIAQAGSAIAHLNEHVV